MAMKKIHVAHLETPFTALPWSPQEDLKVSHNPGARVYCMSNVPAYNV